MVECGCSEVFECVFVGMCVVCGVDYVVVGLLWFD